MKNYLDGIDKAIETDPYENVYTDNGILSVNSSVERKQYVHSTFSTYGECYTNPIPATGFWDWYKIENDKNMKKLLLNSIDFIPDVQEHFHLKSLQQNSSTSVSVKKDIKTKIGKIIKYSKNKLKTINKNNRANTKHNLSINITDNENLQNKIAEQIKKRRETYLQSIKNRLKLSEMMCYAHSDRHNNIKKATKKTALQNLLYFCSAQKYKVSEIFRFMQVIYSFYSEYPIVVTKKNINLFMIYCYNINKEKMEKYKVYTINSLETTLEEICCIIVQGEENIRKNIKLYHDSLGIKKKINKEDLQKYISEFQKEKINNICKSNLLRWDCTIIPNLFFINSTTVSAKMYSGQQVIITVKVLMILENLTNHYVEYFGIKPILLVHDNFGEKYFVYYISNDSFGYTCRCFKTFEKAKQYVLDIFNGWLKVSEKI